MRLRLTGFTIPLREEWHMKPWPGIGHIWFRGETFFGWVIGPWFYELEVVILDSQATDFSLHP